MRGEGRLERWTIYIYMYIYAHIYIYIYTYMRKWCLLETEDGLKIQELSQSGGVLRQLRFRSKGTSSQFAVEKSNIISPESIFCWHVCPC